jgi:hypothetical protein
LRAAEQQEREDVAQARAAWRANTDGGVGGIDPERLVFLDECGVLTNMVPLHGRSPRGTRAYGSAPFGHWTRVTVLGALGAEGIVGAMSVEAATSAAVFHAYLVKVWIRPDGHCPVWSQPRLMRWDRNRRQRHRCPLLGYAPRSTPAAASRGAGGAGVDGGAFGRGILGETICRVGV